MAETARDAAGEVAAAVLKVTPVDEDREVVTGFRRTDVFGHFPEEPGYDDSVDGTFEVATWGDPAPIAARQGGAAIRKAVALYAAPYTGMIPARWLLDLADEIDGGTDDDRR